MGLRWQHVTWDIPAAEDHNLFLVFVVWNCCPCSLNWTWICGCSGKQLSNSLELSGNGCLVNLTWTCVDFLGTDFLVWAKCCSSTFRPSVFSWCVPCGYSTCWWYSLWFSWECLWLSGTISGRWWWWCTKQATVHSLWKDLQETLEHKPLGRNRFSIWIHKAEEWYTKTTVHIFPRKEAVAKSCTFARFASKGDVSHLTAFVEALEKDCCQTRLGLLEISFHSLLEMPRAQLPRYGWSPRKFWSETSEKLLGLRKLKKPTFQRWTQTGKHRFKLLVSTCLWVFGILVLDDPNFGVWDSHGLQP